jgi:hypothetical protein
MQYKTTVFALGRWSKHCMSARACLCTQRNVKERLAPPKSIKPTFMTEDIRGYIRGCAISISAWLLPRSLNKFKLSSKMSSALLARIGKGSVARIGKSNPIWWIDACRLHPPFACTFDLPTAVHSLSLRHSIEPRTPLQPSHRSEACVSTTDYFRPSPRMGDN